MAHRACTTVGCEGEFTGLVGNARGLQFFFGFADGSNFRLRVNDARNDIVIHVAMLARENFSHSHAFIFRLMREHRATHNVANGVNASNIGRKMIVDDHAPAIHRNACSFQTEIIGVRTTTRRHQHNIGFERNSCTARNRFERHSAALALLLDLGDFGREIESKALLFKNALELLGDFIVHARQNAVEIFNDNNFRAQTTPDRAHFKTNHAPADDNHLARHFVERQCARGRYDDLFIELHINAWRRCNVGTRRDDNVLGLERRDLAVFARHINLASALDRAVTGEGFNLVLLEQKAHAADIGVNRVGLVLHQGCEIELRLTHDNAEIGKVMTCKVEHFRRMQQSLGRNAADVEAGAAMRFALFNNRHFHAELGCTNGANITAGAGADDNEIVGH